MMDVLEIASSGGQWDERTKAGAYEVYARQCNGDMVCTLDVLANRDGPKIPEKTVYDWRKRYGWESKLQAEKQAIAPHSWDLYFGGLAVAAPEVVTYLRSVVNDPSIPHRDRIAASGKLLGQIAVHIGELERRMSGDQAALPAAPLDTMSDAELLDYQDQLRNGSGGTSE